MSDFDMDLEKLLNELEQEKNKRINKLINKHRRKLDIKLGDIIYNVTGIIKVEDIDFKIAYNGRGERSVTTIIYSGTKYKWIKGGFITKTKSTQKGNLYSYSDLKKIDKSKVI